MRVGRQGIAKASDDATPLEAVGDGLERAATAMGPVNREIAPHLTAAVAASTELQERAALKQVGLAAAMAGALRDRGVPDLTATLCAELGALAFKDAYATWSVAPDASDLGTLSREALERLRAAATGLS